MTRNQKRQCRRKRMLCWPLSFSWRFFWWRCSDEAEAAMREELPETLSYPQLP